MARAIHWYRDEVLTRIEADPNGDLFVNHNGCRKHQTTLTIQIIERLERHLGVHITPHQFRHLAAMFYLEAHPEDFETVRALLGHSYSKTTLIYAGTSGHRASRTYASFVTERRDALKLKRQPSRRKVKRPPTTKRPPSHEGSQ